MFDYSIIHRILRKLGLQEMVISLSCARKIAAITLTFLIGLSTPATGQTNNLDDFQLASADAYTHYRQAMFYLRTENPDVAVFELSYMATKWDDLMTRFLDNPPEAYASDPDWREILLSVSTVIGKTIEATERRDVKEARTILKPIRYELAELRRRNGVVVFSDCVDEMNAAFDALYVYRNAPPDFSDPVQVDALRQASVAARDSYAKCRSTAPENIKSDGTFTRLMDDAIKSLDRIGEAIPVGNMERIISILRELRSADQMIFLQFG